MTTTGPTDKPKRHKGPTRFRIDVTERDIAKAEVNNSYKCVVSQAIARKVKDATAIETDSQAIRFTLNGERLVYMTPYAVQGYVIGFDAGDPIEPFSFELRNPRIVRRKVRTANGLVAKRARDKAVTTARRIHNEHVDVKAAASAAYAEARERYAGPVYTSDGQKRRAAPPRVFKQKKRPYGHRLLRINKQQPLESSETAVDQK